MAIASVSGVPTDKMASAALGPTPDTLMSSLKLFSSFWVAKPYSSKMPSPTFRYVYSFPRWPFFSDARVLLVVLQAYPTPPQSMTAR